MAKFLVVRTRTSVTEVHADNSWLAVQLAEDVAGRDWNVKEDRISGVIGLDGAMQHVIDGVVVRKERS